MISPWLRGATMMLAAACLSLCCVVSARAQSIAGDFQPPDPRWIHSNGTIGSLYQGGSTIIIDRNGNGIIGGTDTTDPVYTLPAEARQANNYFLSPTREFLYVAGGQPLAGCSGLTIRIYRLPFPVAAPVLLHADCLPCGVPFNGGFAQWYDSGLAQSAPYATGVSNQRLAFIVTAPLLCGSAQATPELRVYDLNRPTPAGRAVVELSPGWERFTVSQSGTHALVKHDLTNDPTNSDYTLVELCPSVFGNSQRAIDDGRGSIIARVTNVSGGMLTVEVVDDGAVAWDERVADCQVSGGPPLGACCINGVCVQTIQSSCTGTWSVGVSCTSDPCPPPAAPRLSVSVSGPPSATEGDEVTYTLTYQNTGNAAASNVVVENSMPAGVQFVSASNGGARNFANNVVWFLGSLPAGSGARTVTWTGRAPCDQASILNNASTIRANGVASVAGTGSVTTSLTPIFYAPVTVSVQSTPSRTPLMPGDSVTHTIRLVNTGAQSQIGIALGGISPGAFGQFERVTVGGSLVADNTGPDYASIHGDLGPGETVDIELVVRLADCFDLTRNTYNLNMGNQILVIGRCSRLLGSQVIPPAVPLRRPVEASLTVRNIAPGTVGPPITTIGIDGTATAIQPVRAGVALEVEMLFTNVYGVGAVSVTTDVVIPGGITVGSPALLNPVPAGASWDEETRILRYAGSLGPSEAASVRLNCSVATGQCESIIAMEGSTGNCTDLRAGLRLLTAEAAPAEPYLAGVGTDRGLWYNDMSPGSGPRTLLCAPSLNVRSVCREPGGDLFLIGSVCARFNPVTLSFVDVGSVLVPQVLAAGLGHWFFLDGAWDASTQTVIFLGDDPYVSTGYLVRYDPASGAATVLASDGSLVYRMNVAVDAGGRPYVGFNVQGVWTVDLSGPLPRPPGSGVLVPVIPAFGFGTALGDRSYSSVQGLSSNLEGQVYATVRSGFSSSGGGQSITWNVDSLMSIDAGVPSTIDATVAAYAFATPPPPPGLPPGVTMTLPAGTVLAEPLAAGPGGRSFCISSPDGAQPRGLVELPTGIILQTPTIPQFYLHDMVYAGSGGPPCPADFNQDGGIDGADVDAFFSAWEAGDASADVNYDGGVDGADVAYFFAAWEAGGCA